MEPSILGVPTGSGTGRLDLNKKWSTIKTTANIDPINTFLKIIR